MLEPTSTAAIAAAGVGAGVVSGVGAYDGRPPQAAAGGSTSTGEVATDTAPKNRSPGVRKRCKEADAPPPGGPPAVSLAEASGCSLAVTKDWGVVAGVALATAESGRDARWWSRQGSGSTTTTTLEPQAEKAEDAGWGGRKCGDGRSMWSAPGEAGCQCVCGERKAKLSPRVEDGARWAADGGGRWSGAAVEEGIDGISRRFIGDGSAAKDTS